jgi:hypothetical protein
VRRDIRSLLLQRAALEIGVREEGIGEADLRAAYERNPAHELLVRHLVVLSERWRPPAHRETALERAREALERVRAGEPFEAVVAEYSEEPGAVERGGLLQPGREGSWVPEFWRAAAELGQGEVSGVVETEYGFHVIRLEQRAPVPFEEARDQVLAEAVDLSTALARSAGWAEARLQPVIVDTQAIRDWQAGHDVQGPLLHWADRAREPYTIADLERYVSTLPPENVEALRHGGVDYLVGVLGSAARSDLLVQHARSLGVQISPPQRRAIEERWAHRVGSTAEVFRFQAGASDRRVRERALEAVTSERQDILRARSEVARLATVLRSIYPVETRARDAAR